MGFFDGLLDIVKPVADIFTGGMGTVASSVIGGLFGREGARDQNSANAAAAERQMEFQQQQAAEAMNFSSAQAVASRDWAKSMSDTSYVRATQDLRNAGLNPMLSLMHGGASSPSSGAPQGVVGGPGARAEHQNINAGAVASALGIAQGLASLDKTAAETRLIDAQKPETEARTDESRARSEKIIKELHEVMPQQISLMKAEELVKQQEWEKLQEEINRLQAEVKKITNESNRAAAEHMLSELKIVAAKNEERKARGTFGTEVSPYVDDATKLLHGAGSVLRRRR